MKRNAPKRNSVLWISVMLFGCTLMCPTVQAQAQSSSGKTWNPPRTPDGQPDMQGYWRIETADPSEAQATWDVEDGLPPEETVQSGQTRYKPHVIIDPPDGKIPYQPWARIAADETKKNSMNPTKLEDLDSHSRCFQHCWPRQANFGGFQVIQ